MAPLSPLTAVKTLPARQLLDWLRKSHSAIAAAYRVRRPRVSLLHALCQRAPEPSAVDEEALAECLREMCTALAKVAQVDATVALADGCGAVDALPLPVRACGCGYVAGGAAPAHPVIAAHAAARRGSAAVLREILALAPWAAHVVDGQSQSCVAIAVDANSVECVRVLVELGGAPVYRCPIGLPALAEARSTQVMDYLVQECGTSPMWHGQAKKAMRMTVPEMRDRYRRPGQPVSVERIDPVVPLTYHNYTVRRAYVSDAKVVAALMAKFAHDHAGIVQQLEPERKRARLEVDRAEHASSRSKTAHSVSGVAEDATFAKLGLATEEEDRVRIARSALDSSCRRSGQYVAVCELGGHVVGFVIFNMKPAATKGTALDPAPWLRAAPRALSPAEFAPVEHVDVAPPLAQKHIDVSYIYVDRAHRGKRLSFLLLAHAVAAACRHPEIRHAECWHLHVVQTNAPAISLYESLGFVKRWSWSLKDEDWYTMVRVGSVRQLAKLLASKLRLDDSLGRMQIAAAWELVQPPEGTA